jgi:hypothetical protein
VVVDQEDLNPARAASSPGRSARNDIRAAYAPAASTPEASWRREDDSKTLGGPDDGSISRLVVRGRRATSSPRGEGEATGGVAANNSSPRSHPEASDAPGPTAANATASTSTGAAPPRSRMIRVWIIV